MVAEVDYFGGGGLTEDKIWENASPTSSMAGATVISLISGKKLSDYDAIKVEWRLSTTETDDFYIIVPLDKWTSTPTTRQRFIIGGNYSGIGILARYFTYASDTTITAGDCSQLNAARTENAKMIPTKIYGLNF